MDQPLLAQSVSNRQFVLLREADKANGVPLARMLQLSQTTCGSLVRRGFMVWSGHRFMLTKDGRACLENYSNFDLSRSNVAAPLSMFIRERWRALGSPNGKKGRRARSAAA